jgi:HEPN superfamily AbiU2-like protein
MGDQNDDLYKKWDGWIDILGNETIHLNTQRHIFQNVREILRRNPKAQQPDDFFFWVSVWYSSSMAVAVRKLADGDKSSVSFRRLLEGIKNNPEVVSRTRFKQLFVDGNYREFLADADFDRYVGSGREYIDQNAVDSEINELLDRTAKLTHYVNKRVAHHDKKDFDAVPSYSDLHDAIDFLGSLHNRYFLIFKCLDPGPLLPNWGYDWTTVFRVPWLG